MWTLAMTARYFLLPKTKSRAPTAFAKVHICDTVHFEDLDNLQRRLVYESGSREDGLITILLCEYKPLITLGRAGHRHDIALTDEQLEQRGWHYESVSRGGGAILHLPGQWIVNLIVPLQRLEWSVGNYLQRLRNAGANCLSEFGLPVKVMEQSYHIWGKKGICMATGISVRHGCASYGMVLNINAEPASMQHVKTAPYEQLPCMSSLLSEKLSLGKIKELRPMLLKCLAASLECESMEVFTGHNLLSAKSTSEPNAA
jgi:lipoyl(octanoyl) transferase